MANNSKEKTTPTNPRTYLINSVQLTDIMKYLMSRPYGEVVKLMNTLSTLNPQGFDGGEKDEGKK